MPSPARRHFAITINFSPFENLSNLIRGDDHTRQLARILPPVQNHSTIDEQVSHSITVLLGIRNGGWSLNVVQIKDNDIRLVSLLDQAAVVPIHDLGRE